MLANQNQMGYNPLENILNNRKQYNTQNLNLSSITDFLASQGRNGDTILAHINPQEAEMLKQMGGSGTINPNTGLPEFWLDKLLGVVGAIAGNVFLPGFGGIIGGSLGSMAGEGLNKGFKITKGKPNYLKTGLMGAGIGAALPSAASLGGGIANAVGAKSLGTTLSNYGTANSITAALGLNGGKGYTGPIDFLTNAGKSGGAGGAIDSVAKSSGAASEAAKGAAEKGFLENLISNPTNLLMGAGLAGNYFGREKPKSPEQLGREQKAYQQAMQMTPEERKAHFETEMYYDSLKKEKEREERRKNRQDWETNRNAINPLIGGMGFNRIINSPETYAKTGRWMEYEPVRYAKGGIVDTIVKKKEPIIRQTITRILIPLNSFDDKHFFDNKDFDKPEKFATGKFLDGDTHGQEDKIHALLSDGEYVVNASRVADLGDGNNKAGAKFLDKFLKNIAEYKSHNPKKKIPPSILNKKISYFVNQG